MGTEKQLFLLRHAKSSWDDPGIEDHDRPLAARGLRAVELMREHLRTAGVRPALVLCSSARRTRETLAGVAPGGQTTIEPELYGASCSGVIERLHRVPEEIDSVMVVGHNPAMQLLVLRLAGVNGGSPDLLAGAGIGSDLAEVRRKFATGALATLSFECAWSRLGPGCARLVAYVRPKALGASAAQGGQPTP